MIILAEKDEQDLNSYDRTDGWTGTEDSNNNSFCLLESSLPKSLLLFRKKFVDGLTIQWYRINDTAIDKDLLTNDSIVKLRQVGIYFGDKLVNLRLPGIYLISDLYLSNDISRWDRDTTSWTWQISNVPMIIEDPVALRTIRKYLRGSNDSGNDDNNEIESVYLIITSAVFNIENTAMDCFFPSMTVSGYIEVKQKECSHSFPIHSAEIELFAER